MKKFALLGNKIEYSLSPKIHEKILNTLNREGSYQVFDALDDFDGMIEKVKGSDLSGFNVTIPFKERMIAEVDSLSEHAKGVGSINTVVVDEDKWIGYNTDGLGFIKGLSIRDYTVLGKRVLVIGAGGAARGIIHSLLTCGVKQVLFYNRSTKKRNELFSFFNSQFRDGRIMVVDDYSGIVVDLVINTTPVGGKQFPNQRIIDLEKLTTEHVADIVYEPRITPLLSQAMDLGKTVYFGIDMLVCQAVLAQEIWQDTKLSDDDVKEIIDECIQ